MSIVKYLKSQLSLAKDDFKFRALNSTSDGVYQSDKLLFKWQDVSSIEAYKRDMITEDLICLDIELSLGNVYTLHEELKGFKEFNSMMQSQLCLNNEKWFIDVVQPPFEECRTTVYSAYNKSINKDIKS